MFTSWNSLRQYFFPPARLFLNHADAWVSTLAIAVAALLLHDALNIRSLGLALTIAAGYWLAFAINDYYDAPFDLLDPEKARRNYFVLNRPSPGKMRLFVGLALLVITPVFVSYGGRGLLVAAVGAFIMWGYSAPPLRFKARPGLDLLIHTCFVQTFPYVATLYLIGASWNRLDMILLIIGVMASAMAQFEQQIRDAAIDAAVEETLTTRIGPERALFILKAGTIILVIFGLTNIFNGTIPLPIGVLGLLTLPAVIPRLWRKPNEPRPERLIRVLVVISFVYVIILLTWSALVDNPIVNG